MTQSTQPLWRPSAERVATSNLTNFAQACGHTDYASLHAWSVTDRSAFWSTLWDHAGVIGARGARATTQPDEQMPGTRFFPDAQLNFAENLLAPGHDDDHALIAAGEGVDPRVVTRAELRERVAVFAGWLRQGGVQPGDRVAAVLPNLPETIVAALAAAQIGAVWSSCSPDFGEAGILDRFAQIEPTVLIGVDGYRYGGKRFDVRDKLDRVRSALGTVLRSVMVSYLGESASAGWTAWDDAQAEPLTTFERFGFDHPLYILFSSGTTGAPKCIVHGAGGTLLQHAKEHRLHSDIKPGDRVCYFTTCGWMMWNWLVSVLATGATVALYEGSPAHPGPDRLLALADELDLTFLGLSAGLITAMRQGVLKPSDDYAMTALRCIASTGSPLSDASFRYVYSHIKQDVQLASISGGTDIVSCFVLGNPNAPVHAGQIQCAGLGMAVDVVDAACASLPAGHKGELVCRAPFPSMPVGFWKDDDGARYRSAYFERFDNVWHHGDFAEKTAQGGIVIHGRSDATLNPGGVRIGTAEIYRVLERIEGITDAAAVGIQQGEDVVIVLLVVAPNGLDEALIGHIRSRIRAQASPRHVPRHVVAIPAVPKTRTGKTAELALKTWLEGGHITNRNALNDAELFDQTAPALSS